MKVEVKTTVVVAGILFFLYVANLIYAVWTDQSGGTFGDSFGAVNALFSGSALFFLVLAFISQREELNLVKEERNDTRKLLEGQEAINMQQRMALDRQSFEQSYFAILNQVYRENERLNQTAPSDHTKSRSILDLIKNDAILVVRMSNGHSLVTDKEFSKSKRNISVAAPLLALLVAVFELLDLNETTIKENKEFFGQLAAVVATDDLAMVFFALEASLAQDDVRKESWANFLERIQARRMLTKEQRSFVDGS